MVSILVFLDGLLFPLDRSSISLPYIMFQSLFSWMDFSFSIFPDIDYDNFAVILVSILVFLDGLLFHTQNNIPFGCWWVSILVFLDGLLFPFPQTNTSTAAYPYSYQVVSILVFLDGLLFPPAAVCLVG